MVPEILLAASTSSNQDTKQIQVTKELRPYLRSAVILTLGYCYHSRLMREQRAGYSSAPVFGVEGDVAHKTQCEVA